MFVGMAAVSVVATAVSAAQREAAAKGQPMSPEVVAGLSALVAGAQGILDDERTIYEDAGLMRVYPKDAR